LRNTSRTCESPLYTPCDYRKITRGQTFSLVALLYKVQMEVHRTVRPDWNELYYCADEFFQLNGEQDARNYCNYPVDPVAFGSP